MNEAAVSSKKRFLSQKKQEYCEPAHLMMIRRGVLDLCGWLLQLLLFLLETRKMTFPLHTGEAKKLPSTLSLHKFSPDSKSIAQAIPPSEIEKTKIFNNQACGHIGSIASDGVFDLYILCQSGGWFDYKKATAPTA